VPPFKIINNRCAFFPARPASRNADSDTLHSLVDVTHRIGARNVRRPGVASTQLGESANASREETILPTRAKLRSALLKTVLLLLGITTALALIEVMLRFSNPFQTRLRGDQIILLKNKTIRIKNNTFKRLDPAITVTLNSLGFRGVEPPADFGHYLTIITIGGSTTYCWMLSDGKTWPAELGNQLGETFQGVWINNAGLMGNSTFAHIALLKEVVSKLHPKVVLFLVGVNDLAAERAPELDSENLRGRIIFSSPKAFVLSISAYSEVVGLGVNLYHNYVAYRFGLIQRNPDLTKVGHLAVPRELEEAYVARSTAPYIQSYETRLKRLIDISREAGIEPVFITQPLLVGPAVDDRTKVDLAALKIVKRDGTVNGEMWWESCLRMKVLVTTNSSSDSAKPRVFPSS
jgi:lysophospholipase L1-like esterase